MCMAHGIDALLPVGGAVAQQRGGVAAQVVQPARAVHARRAHRHERCLERFARHCARTALAHAHAPAHWPRNTLLLRYVSKTL